MNGESALLQRSSLILAPPLRGRPRLRGPCTPPVPAGRLAVTPHSVHAAALDQLFWHSDSSESDPDPPTGGSGFRGWFNSILRSSIALGRDVDLGHAGTLIERIDILSITLGSTNSDMDVQEVVDHLVRSITRFFAGTPTTKSGLRRGTTELAASALLMLRPRSCSANARGS